MKFTINKNKLLENLKICNDIVSNVNINPILSGVLIKVEDNNISLICSNQNTSCNIKIDNNLSISSPGEFLIKCSLLFNIISKILEDKITFNLIDNSIIRISTDKFTSDLNLLDGFSYPLIDFSHNNWKQIKINNELFKKINNKLISTTLSTLDQTNILTGVSFNTERLGDFIEIISTDSFHLGYLKQKYNGEKVKFILNTETIKLINLLTDKNNDVIDIYLNKNNIILISNNTTILTRVIEGEYPLVNKSIEQKHQYKFTINKKELLNSINRGSVVLTSDKKPIIQFNIKQDELNINFRSIEYGSCYEQIKIEQYTGPEFNIYLNSKFLLDLIKGIDSDKIEFNFTNEIKPIILKDLEDLEYTSLILPIKNN